MTVVSGYVGTQVKAELRPVCPTPVANFNLENALKSFDNVVSGTAPAGFYAPDKRESQFVKATADNQEWSLNHLDTALRRAFTKQGSVYKVPGLDGMSYYGREHTIFPIHTEGGDLWSVNYLHSGAPKIWFCVAQKQYGKVKRLLRRACVGNCS